MGKGKPARRDGPRSRGARAAALMVALACPACGATVMPRPNEPVDVDVARVVRRVRGEKTVGRVEQHGSTVTVLARRTCDLEKVRIVDRTSLVELPKQPTSIGLPVLTGIYLSVTGVTTTTVALAADYSHSLRDAAIGAGITAVGATVLTLGAIALKKPRRVVSVERIDREDGLLQRDVPCRDVPNAAGREPVTGRAAAIELPFGDTDDRGALTIDLAATLPPSLLREAAPGATVRLFVREVEVGTVRLDEAARAVEAQAWARAEAETCATGSADDACRETRQYLHDFPAGARAEQARSAIERWKAEHQARRAAAAKEQAKADAAALKEQAKATAEALREQARATAEALREQAARRGAALACRRTCQTSCGREASCESACVARSCP